MENNHPDPINDHFKNAILGVLLEVKKGYWVTREQMLTEAGYPSHYAPLINILVQTDPQFSEFEGKKGRGYRRKDL